MLFGGALAGGLLAPLTWVEAAVGVVVLLVVRPAAGLLGFVGSGAPWADRAVVAFFGIRGVGSFYHLSYALAHASFRERELVVAAEELCAFVGFVVLGSIVIHGVSSTPVMDALDRHRGASREG